MYRTITHFESFSSTVVFVNMKLKFQAQITKSVTSHLIWIWLDKLVMEYTQNIFVSSDEA